MDYEMTGNPEIINPLTYPGWDALLDNTRDASFFHTSAWTRALYDTYGYNPVYFAQISNNRFQFLMPVMEVNSALTGRRGVALPFCDDCEPVLHEEINSDKTLAFIINYGKTRNWKHLLLKHKHPLHDHPPYQRYVLHNLKLTRDADQLFSAFKSSTKRNISKALKAQLQMKADNTPEALKTYYHLHCLTRKRHGVPPQPFCFFKNIYNNILVKNNGLIFLAEHHGTPVAGAVYFHYQDKAYYKYGAFDQRYQHLRASYLVMASAIRHYAEQGCTSLCFGRTEPDNAGLLQFKNSWNGDITDLNYYKYNFKEKSFEKEKNSSKYFSYRL